MVSAAPSASPSHSPTFRPTKLPTFAPTSEYEQLFFCMEPHVAWAGVALALAIVFCFFTGMWLLAYYDQLMNAPERSAMWHTTKWVSVFLNLAVFAAVVPLCVIPREPGPPQQPCTLWAQAHLTSGRLGANLALSALVFGSVGVAMHVFAWIFATCCTAPQVVQSYAQRAQERLRQTGLGSLKVHDAL